MFDPRLIFDLGAHDGKDSRYYLERGFKVVAVEAHPDHARVLQRAGSYPDLMVANRALADTALQKVKLYSSNRPGGETHSVHPHRVKDIEAAPIEVEATTLPRLFVTHGVPFYLKVDIEGSDIIAIRQLHEWHAKGEALPPYLSVELDADHPEEALEMFAHLGYMGYDTFRLINQRLVPTGAYGEGFTWGMSGPFGEDVFRGGCGYSLGEIAAWWFSNARMFKRDWFDLHCRLQGEGRALETYIQHHKDSDAPAHL